MKVAVINNLYPPYHRGGAEVVAQNQASQLIDLGHDVFVITTKPLFKGELANHGKIKNIYRFYALNIFSFYNLNKFPLPLRAIWRVIDIFNFYSYFKIKKILKRQKPELVYTHNLTGLGYLIPKLIKKLKIKNIQVIHDVTLVRPSGLLLCGQEKENIFIKIYSGFTRYLFNSPDEVNFPSQWLKNYYNQHNFFPQSKKQVIRNFNLKIEKLKLDKAKIFLFVGQIEEHKGILFLINIFNKLNNYKLNIVGTGSKLKQAKKLAKNNSNIIFYGYQSAEKFLNQADYTIVPSLCYENSPTIIFESLKANIPVIASDIGGIAELVKDGVNGYLFNPVDKNSLLKILKNTIINTDEKKQ